MRSGCIPCRSKFSLTSVLAGGEWSASRPGRFTAGERATGTHWLGGWVNPGASMDMEKIKFLTLPGLEFRPLSRPARSQSLYRLRYSGSLKFLNGCLNNFRGKGHTKFMIFTDCIDTPWYRSLHKLTFTPFLKKFCALEVTQTFITVFTRARHWNLSWVTCI
jgi:hypothetical protein